MKINLQKNPKSKQKHYIFFSFYNSDPTTEISEVKMNYFTIVAPKSIRSTDSEYHVAVTTIDTSCNLMIKLISDDTNKTVLSKSVQLERKTTELVQFDVSILLV